MTLKCLKMLEAVLVSCKEKTSATYQFFSRTLMIADEFFSLEFCGHLYNVKLM